MSRLQPCRNRFGWRIFLIALVLRLVPVFLARSLGIGLDDMFQYDMLARSLAAGNGFRWYASADLQLLAPYVDFDLTSGDYDPVRGVETSFRAPLYPAFLSIIYWLIGNGANRFFAARFAQAFLGAALAPLTYWVALYFLQPRRKDDHGKELTSRRNNASFLPQPGLDEEPGGKAARRAAWVVAVYPILLAYPLGLGTENPFFLLLLASFFLLLKAAEHPSTSRFLLAGFFLGLTALTRSVILPFAGLAILWIWFALKHRRGAFLTALALTLSIAPWIVRNSLLHHKPTGIETSMGYNLYLGYHPQGNGSFVFGPSLDLLTILDDAERDRIGTEKAIEFIRAEPDRFLPLAVNRLGYFFGLEKRVLMYFYGNDLVGFIPFPLLLILFLVILLPFVFISLTAVLGASVLRWNSATILLSLLFIAYILPHVFILAEDRFHLALVPFFAILASRFHESGWKTLAARWNESRAGKIAIGLAVCAILLLLINWGLELSRDADRIVQLLSPSGNHSNTPY